MKPDLTVAAIIDSIEVSGPARQLAAIAVALEAHRVRVEVLALSPASTHETPLVRHLAAKGVACRPIAAAGLARFSATGAIVRALETIRPQIVQTHSYRPNAYALLLRRLGVLPAAWVAHHHGTTQENLKSRSYHAIDRLVLRRADSVFFVAEAHRCRHPHVKRAFVIPNAVLPVPAEPARSTSACGAGTVLYMGRLSHEKGVDVLLRSWPAVVSARPGIQLRIVGHGVARRALERLARRLRCLDSVTFVDHTAEPWGHYREASVVVLPSRSEGFPNVLLEAIACGAPVVATAVGAVPLALGTPPAGVLVPPEHPGEIARAILQVLENSVDSRYAAAGERVCREFSVDRRTRALLDAYAQVIADAGNDGRAPRR